MRGGRDETAAGSGCRDRGDDGGQQAAPSARSVTGRSPWSSRATCTTTSRATCSCRSAPTPPQMWSSRPGSSSRTVSSWSPARSTGSSQTTSVVLLTDGRIGCPTTTWSSRQACSHDPTRRPGMLDGGQWRESIHEFYTFDGALALREKLSGFTGGRVVVHVVEMPIKCPVAPLEFAFLADAFFRDRGMRDRVELVYVTPLPGCVHQANRRRPARRDARRAQDRGRAGLRRRARRRRPANAGLLRRAGGAVRPAGHRPAEHGRGLRRPLGPGRRAELRAGRQAHAALNRARRTSSPSGTPSDIPTSKAGSVAHFSVEVFVDNFLAHVDGRPMTGSFDGHANCYVEAGDGKALLIDFNYDTEPLPGHLPRALHRPVPPARGDPGQPLGQARVPVDVLAPPPARPPHPAAGPHVDGRQEDARG